MKSNNSKILGSNTGQKINKLGRSEKQIPSIKEKISSIINRVKGMFCFNIYLPSLPSKSNIINYLKTWTIPSSCEDRGERLEEEEKRLREKSNIFAPDFCNAKICSTLKDIFIEKGIKQPISFVYRLSKMSGLYGNFTNRKSPPGFDVFFINGVDNTLRLSLLNVKYLSNLLGGIDIISIFNATHGIFKDLYETFLNCLGFNSEPVRILKSAWIEYFKNNPNNKILQVCHSQGSVIVYNALKEVSEEIRKKIKVVCIAPLKPMKNNKCGGVKNYISNKDIWINGLFYLKVPDWKRCSIVQSSNYIIFNILQEHRFHCNTYARKLVSQYRRFFQATQPVDICC